MDHVAIESFAEAFADAPCLAELEVRSPAHGLLRLRRSLVSADRKPQPATVPVALLVPSTPGGDVAPPAPSVTVVTSVLVGVFRAHVKTPVGVGSVVSPGQPLGFVEVMRLSSDVPAPVGGTVTALLVQDGQPVEYGQPLFEIDPAPAKKETENE